MNMTAEVKSESDFLAGFCICIAHENNRFFQKTGRPLKRSRFHGNHICIELHLFNRSSQSDASLLNKL